jgi:hypothetical protein
LRILIGGDLLVFAEGAGVWGRVADYALSFVGGFESGKVEMVACGGMVRGESKGR